MLFNSWHFVAFLLVVLSVACWLPRYGRAWKFFLIGASCYFYGQWSWKYLSLIALTATVDYLIAQRLAASSSPRRLITISLVANLGVLAFFKYANFFIASVNGLGEAAGAALLITPLDIIRYRPDRTRALREQGRLATQATFKRIARLGWDSLYGVDE